MNWGRIILWLVLGLSLFANAVVLGLFLRFGGLGDDVAGMRAAWSDLPADARAAVRSDILKNRDALRGLLAELRAARTDMLAAAAARPYDRAAVKAAQDRVQVATEALQVRIQDLMLRAFDRAAGAAPEGSP